MLWPVGGRRNVDAAVVHPITLMKSNSHGLACYIRSVVGSCIVVVALCTMPSASATVVVSASGDLTGWGTFWGPSTSATADSVTPFISNGVSQGDYINTHGNGPLKAFASPLLASESDIWVSYLINVPAANLSIGWGGGISLFTDYNINHYVGGAGWYANSHTISGIGADYGLSAGYLLAADTQVAVLAHFYSSDATTYNRMSLFIDSNLSDGVSYYLGSALFSDFNLAAGVQGTASYIRLDGEDIRYYDNVTVATTSAEALAGVSGTLASVPEPSTYAAIFGAVALGCAAYKRRSSAVVQQGRGLVFVRSAILFVSVAAVAPAQFVSLLHFNGANGETVIVDEGVNTWTVSGNAALSANTAKWGQSVHFDGSGDYLTVNDLNAFKFGSSTFTIDFWINPANTNDAYLLGRDNSNGGAGFDLRIQGGGIGVGD